MIDFQHPFFDEVYYFEKLNSTSAKAIELIKNKTASGNFLVIAKTQTAGIGRNKNAWFSPEGGIWITAALYGMMVESNLTIFTGISLHQALLQQFPELADRLKIKWPNDIYLDGKKLCGILASHLLSQKYHILGIGINTNIETIPAEIQDIAISLRNALDREIDNEELMKNIFDVFAASLPEFIEGPLDNTYFNQFSLLIDHEIELDTDFDHFNGICKGINKKGALLIELKPGMIQPFYAGTVTKW